MANLGFSMKLDNAILTAYNEAKIQLKYNEAQTVIVENSECVLVVAVGPRRGEVSKSIERLIKKWETEFTR
jgi:hypothetical protein